MKKRKLSQQHKFKISKSRLKQRFVKKAVKEGAKAAERAAIKTGVVTVQRPPFSTTAAGGVRILLDLDDLARTLHFIDCGTNKDILPAFRRLLKPWGLPDEVISRFEKMATS